MRRGVLVVPLVMLLVACGAPPATTMADPAPDDCDLAWEQIATAVEAHYAATGFDVTTLDELTPDFLTSAPTDWTLEANPGDAPTVIGRAGRSCEGRTGDAENVPPQSIPPERQNPLSTTGIECFVQQPMLSGAVHAYAAESGHYPTTQDELIDAELIPFEFELYDINGPGSVAKTFDGDCFVRSAELPAPFDEYNSMCFSNAIRLWTAVESHRTLTGVYPASVDVLIDREYVFGAALNYSIDSSGHLLPVDPTFCPGPISSLDDSDPDCQAVMGDSIDLCLRAGD